MVRVTNTLRGRLPSLPSVVFALASVLLGWIAGHYIVYTLFGLVPSGVSHGHAEQHIHGYLEVLKLAGGGGLVVAFSLALRSFFRHGSFGEWLHDGGIAGTRKQVALVTVLPAGFFVAAEHAERLIAGTGTVPSAQLLLAGVFVQLVVGLLCLGLVRMTFRVAERVILSVTSRHHAAPGRRSAGLALRSIIFARSLSPMAGSEAGRAPPSLTPSL